MNDTELRKHLVALLTAGHAHISLNDAVKGFPAAKAGIRPPGAPHSAWELVEHIRIAMDDIIRFSGVMDERPSGKNPPKSYVELTWPDDYWPKSPAPKSAAAWKASLAAIDKGLVTFMKYIQDPKHDLLEPFPWGSGQTLLREALLIADHSAYHVGQVRLVRQLVEEH